MRDEKIPQLMDELGRLATTFSLQVNKLQSQGLDLNGNVGGLMFTDFNSDIVAKSRVVTASDSTADLAVYVEDISQLKGENILCNTWEAIIMLLGHLESLSLFQS